MKNLLASVMMQIASLIAKATNAKWAWKAPLVLIAALSLHACSTTQKQSQAVSVVEQEGRLFPELGAGVPVVWSKNLVHSGIGAAINQRTFEAFRKIGVSGLNRYEETNVLEVSPRYQMVWFFKDGKVGGGDKQLFIHTVKGDEAGEIINGQVSVLIMAVVDIQKNRLVWRGIVRRDAEKKNSSGARVLAWVDELAYSAVNESSARSATDPSNE